MNIDIVYRSGMGKLGSGNCMRPWDLDELEYVLFVVRHP